MSADRDRGVRRQKQKRAKDQKRAQRRARGANTGDPRTPAAGDGSNEAAAP